MKDTSLTAARLLALYDQVAGAEDAIPRLRRFVLDLAVRGKLVAQDAGDEPAEELLKRIAKEKARLVNAGEIKDRISPRRNGEVASTSPVPHGWEMSDLQSVCTSVTDGDHLPPPKADEGVPFLVIGDVRTGTIEFSGDRFVSQEYYDALDPIRRPRSGDLLYTLVGSYGIPVIVTDDRPFCVQRHIGILRPSKEIDVGFLARSMESQFVFDQATNCATGIAQKTVPLSGLRNIDIRLPPLAEQRRIVGRVEELMALCDQLQAARAGERAVRDRLTTATLSRLTAPDQPPEAAPQNARFALQSLPTLTTHAAQIKTLRQTILNLAVRGKLLAQDPTGEPAAELLNRIGNKRAALVAAGIAKKEKLVEDVAAPFALPDSWSWCGLGQLCQLITKGSSPKWQGVSYVTGDTGLMFITSENVGNFTLRKLDDLKYVESRFRDIEPRSMLRKGDILINLVGASIGRTAIFDLEAEANINQAVALVRLVDPTLGPSIDYLLMYLNSDTAVDQMLGSRVITAQPNISLADVNGFPIPLPPRAEQHRIVARVDALMALCDRLEASLTTTTTTRSRLLEALLHEALNGALGDQTEAAA
jgi:type I restriction enzyme S subunit